MSVNEEITTMPCRRTLPAWLLALPIAFCTLPLLTACALSAATASPPAALLPTATTPALLATPTSTTFTLAPIATLTPQLVTGARLGGPVSAFDARYGAEVDQDVWNATIDGLAVQITITPTTNVGDSSDGQDRAVIIDITNPNGAGSLWSDAQEAALVAPFLPTDAHHLRTNPGDSAFGPEHLSTSATLAHSLDHTVFQNGAGLRITPGTFDWLCSALQPMCEIAAGYE